MVSSDKVSPSLYRIQKKDGCASCPLDKAPDTRKIRRGDVNGRKVFIWGLAPGRQENEKGREFVGESGQLLWKELGLVGIKRKHCDIQNVVRCFPTKKDGAELKMRNPCEDEIRCCSEYTEVAKKKSKAKLHIIFGKIAGKALLHDEYRKGELFRSETLKSQVLCMWHPSYLVRNGCSAARTQKSKEKLKRWQQDFKVAKNFLGRKEHGLESADQVLE